MIQLTRTEDSLVNQYVYINLYDTMTAITYSPLFMFTSQLTGKSVYVIPSATDYTNKSRYVKMTLIPNYLIPVPASGYFIVGTDDLPYGLYDVNIYQNNSGSNLDPDNAIKKIYEGLMNLTQSGNPAVTYTEYTTNDTDTESVYITNVI